MQPLCVSWLLPWVVCVCRSYKDFVLKVAAARNMKPEEVHKIAKGRIWTGQDAFQLGLVDELGGLTRAIALAKQLADLPQVPILMSLLATGLSSRQHLKTAE